MGYDERRAPCPERLARRAHPALVHDSQGPWEEQLVRRAIDEQYVRCQAPRSVLREAACQEHGPQAETNRRGGALFVEAAGRSDRGSAQRQYNRRRPRRQECLELLRERLGAVIEDEPRRAHVRRPVGLWHAQDRREQRERKRRRELSLEERISAAR